MTQTALSWLTSHALRRLTACMICLNIMAVANAEDIVFDCINGSQGQLNCGVVNAPNASIPAPIRGLVYSVVDAMDGNIGNQVNTCNSPIDSVGTSCALGTGQDAMNLNCTQDLQNPNAVNCRMNAGQSNDVLALDCFVRPDGTTTRCAFKSDKDKMVDQMTNESFNGNEDKMVKSMMACLGNTNQEGLCLQMMNMMLNGDNNSKQQLAQFMRKLTPRKPDAMMDVSSQNMRTATQLVKQRLGKLRAGQFAKHSQGTQYYDGQQWHSKGTLLAQASNSKTDVSPTLNLRQQSPWGVYVNGTVIRAEQSASELESSHDAKTQVLTFGSDYRFNQHWYAGLAYNLTSSNTDYSSNTGELDTSSHGLVAYASYAQGNWYIDTSLNYSRDSYEQDRNVSCSIAECGAALAFSQTFRSEFDGQQTAFNLASGYNWQHQQWTITPAIQIAQARIETDAYKEKPSSAGTGSGYALNLDDASRDLTTVTAGAQVQYAISTEKGVFIPSFSLKTVKEFDDDTQVISGRFIGNIGTDDSFNLLANKVDTQYLIVAAGMNVQLKNGNAGFVNVQSIENFEHLKQIQLSAGWRWEF